MTKMKKAILGSGYKQKWVAERLRIDETALSHYASGRRKAPDDVLRRMAKVLGVKKSKLA